MSYPVGLDPYATLDPQSDEHLTTYGWRVGYVDITNGYVGDDPYPRSIRAYIVGDGWSASLWRPVRDEGDWNVEFVTLPGYCHGSGGPAIQSGWKLPDYSPWRRALDHARIGDLYGCTPEDYRQAMADAVEAQSERLYASSYGLGL